MPMRRAGRDRALLERVADGVASRGIGRERDERREGLHVGEPSGEAVDVDDAPDRGADGDGRRRSPRVAQTYLPPPSEIITSTPQISAATPRNMIVCPDTASIARMRSSPPSRVAPRERLHPGRSARESSRRPNRCSVLPRASAPGSGGRPPVTAPEGAYHRRHAAAEEGRTASTAFTVEMPRRRSRRPATATPGGSRSTVASCACRTSPRSSGPTRATRRATCSPTTSTSRR